MIGVVLDPDCRDYLQRYESMTNSIVSYVDFFDEKNFDDQVKVLVDEVSKHFKSSTVDDRDRSKGVDSFDYTDFGKFDTDYGRSLGFSEFTSSSSKVDKGFFDKPKSLKSSLKTGSDTKTSVTDPLTKEALSEWCTALKFFSSGGDDLSTTDSNEIFNFSSSDDTMFPTMFDDDMIVDSFDDSSDVDVDVDVDSGSKESTGKWTKEEHLALTEGLKLHGKGWKKIATLVKTKTVVQVRIHAQKYFLKLTKARQSLGYQRKQKSRQKYSEKPVVVEPSLDLFFKEGSVVESAVEVSDGTFSSETSKQDPHSDPAVSDKGLYCHCGGICDSSGCYCKQRGIACVGNCDCSCSGSKRNLAKQYESDLVYDDDISPLASNVVLCKEVLKETPSDSLLKSIKIGSEGDKQDPHHDPAVNDKGLYCPCGGICSSSECYCRQRGIACVGKCDCSCSGK